MGDIIDQNRFFRKLNDRKPSAADPLRIEVAWNLVDLADSVMGGELTAKLGELRRTLQTEASFTLPPVRVLDHPRLGDNAYRIRIGDKLASHGVVYSGWVMLLEEDFERLLNELPEGKIEAQHVIEAVDPEGKAACWFPRRYLTSALESVARAPEDVIVSHLMVMVLNHLDEVRECMNPENRDPENRNE